MLQLPGLESTDQTPVARATEPAGALRELFGFEAFRAGQRAAVEAVLAGRDTLVVMPTGAGKSLCYQLPALMRSDLTVVVSPLVALMADQVAAAGRVAPGRVALVNGLQESRANKRALDAAARGDLRILYVAPERFASEAFITALAGARVGRFVVDEAHCVSHWGHDFRPDYLRLGEAARWLGAESIVAATATATPRVAADIVERLALRDPLRVATGFDRPNLTFAVARCSGAAAAQRGVSAALARPGALPAIVYAGTRADCERLATQLGRELDVTALPYHAGLPRERRSSAQRRFMAGEVPLVVATNAFGMGVDKADVRTVCHATVPVSLEAYYQEAGRAGRDARPARALLFASAKDKGLHVHFAERALIQEAELAAVADTLAQGAAGGRYDVDLDALAADAGTAPDQLPAILGHLVRAGALIQAAAPRGRTAGTVSAAFAGPVREAARAQLAVAERARWTHYRAVWDWVEGRGCRRAGILAHFGEDTTGAGDPLTVPCCDICDPSVRPRIASGRRARSAPRQLTTVPLTAAGRESTLDAAILRLIELADPPLSRDRCVAILRGSRAAALRRHGYDGLPAYGTYAHLGASALHERIEALLDAGALRARAAVLERG